MDPKDIRELVELISRSNFEEFEMEEEGFKLRLIKQSAGAAVAVPAVGEPAAAAVAVPVQAAPASSAQPAEVGLVDLVSPIVGTFYRASSPDVDPFVEAGAKIKKGQVICIVEAMKVMNEIESEFDGEVVEVLLTNGQPVEFGEAMFRLRPTR